MRTEVMNGTWEALTSGQADLAIGVGADRGAPPGVQLKELGPMEFLFAVAPHHPLAATTAPISDAELLHHRAVAVADSAQRLTPMTVNLLPGQDVLTVSSMQLKIEAQLRCMGCGFVPEPLAREHIAAGRLVVKATQRGAQHPRLAYAWRTPTTSTPGAGRKPQLGLALRWWIDQLESPTTRAALLEHHSAVPLAGM
jgi:DNA-binding transcriptional LysR family regulator